MKCPGCGMVLRDTNAAPGDYPGDQPSNTSSEPGDDNPMARAVKAVRNKIASLHANSAKQSKTRRY